MRAKDVLAKSGEAAHALAFPPVARFRFRLTALDPIRLPEYAGSAWRGLLGHGLRRTACVTRQPVCDGCLLLQGCVYARLFETPPPPDLGQPGFTAMPHPFVLDIDPTLPRQREPGQGLILGVTLIGGAIADMPYLIHALGLAGQRGIGTRHAQFQVDAVEQETVLGSDDWARIYSSDDPTYRGLAPPALIPIPARVPLRVRLMLRTPLRIKRDGRFVTPSAFALAELLRHLHTRLHRLARLYGGPPAAFADPVAGDAQAGLNLFAARLRWHDWTRYSSRQHSLMQMGGLIGEIDIEGPGLAALWPALWLGQWVHVGKGTAFGLGSYRLQGADADPSAA